MHGFTRYHEEFTDWAHMTLPPFRAPPAMTLRHSGHPAMTGEMLAPAVTTCGEGKWGRGGKSDGAAAAADPSGCRGSKRLPRQHARHRTLQYFAAVRVYIHHIVVVDIRPL